jgi:uroporphyrinogen decarboxylase
MLISPALFEEFCAPFYREVSALCRDCNVDVFAIDSDGNVMEFVDVIARSGVNALYPFEVKAGNDLSAIRNRHERFVMFGGLEKEVLNRGNTHLLRAEIMGKVPGLLRGGRYFPNADHGIQPMVTFENLCMFMTLVHDVCGNPEGEFPRMRP